MSLNPEEPQYREPVVEPEETSNEEGDSEEGNTDDEELEEPTAEPTGPTVEPEVPVEELPPVNNNLSKLLEELGLVDNEEPAKPNSNEEEPKFPIDKPVEPNTDDEQPGEVTSDDDTSDKEMADTVMISVVSSQLDYSLVVLGVISRSPSFLLCARLYLFQRSP